MTARSTRMLLGLGAALVLQGLTAVLLGISAEYLHSSSPHHRVMAPVWSGATAIATGLLAGCSGMTPKYKWLRHGTHALSFVTCIVSMAAFVVGIMGAAVTCPDDVTSRVAANPCEEGKALHVAGLCVALGTLIAAAVLFLTCCSYYVTCPTCDVKCPVCDVTRPTSDVTCPTVNVICFPCNCLKSRRIQKKPPEGAPLPSRRDTAGDASHQDLPEHAHENPYVYPSNPPPYHIPDVQEVDPFEMAEKQPVKKTVRFQEQNLKATKL